MAPYDFDGAKAAIEAATIEQERLEERIREVYREAAEADERFRVALARTMLELRDSGVTSWSACETLARGKAENAQLRREKEVAEGLKEAVSQAAFRVSADRRDLSKLIDWSSRVAMASGDVW